jgi:hypothetical protein
MMMDFSPPVISDYPSRMTGLGDYFYFNKPLEGSIHGGPRDVALGGSQEIVDLVRGWMAVET